MRVRKFVPLAALAGALAGVVVFAPAASADPADCNGVVDVAFCCANWPDVRL